MNKNDLKLLTGSLENHKPAMRRFLVEHFYKNPLNMLIQIPPGEREIVYEAFIRNYNVLAFYNDELVGCKTGSVMTYGEMAEVQYVQ